MPYRPLRELAVYRLSEDVATISLFYWNSFWGEASLLDTNLNALGSRRKLCVVKEAVYKFVKFNNELRLFHRSKNKSSAFK
jgi:hypothetical protein